MPELFVAAEDRARGPSSVPRFSRRSPLISALLLLIASHLLTPPSPCRADPADARWAGIFVPPGVTGTVECAVAFNGELIVGGTLTQAGSVPVHNIARWDGSAWHPLGPGLNNSVLALGVYNGDLYAGGLFTAPGDGAATSLLKLARWNGADWVEVGGGVTDGSGIYAMTVHGGQLIVGGSFAGLGAPLISAENVAGWNGTGWDTLAGGLDKVVRALSVFQTNLVAGGYFVDRLSRYNGVNWQRLGDGFDPMGGVEALAVYNGKLYVGGSFEAVDGGILPAANLAAFDGATWTVPGGGVGVGNVDVVHDLIVAGPRLFIGGAFLSPGAALLRWDDVTLAPLAAGVDGQVRAFGLVGTALYAGGQFHEGTTTSRNIVRWNSASSNYLPLNYGLALDAPASHLSTWNSKLVIGGPFTFAAGKVTNGIATSDGYNVAACGTGLTPPPSEDPCVYGSGILAGELVVGGSFTAAGGVAAANIARWTGAAWSSLGVGFDGRVFDIETYDGQIVAAGSFGLALDRNLPVGHIATWDGGFWQPLETGLSGGSEIVNALAVYKGELIAAGSFSQAGGAPASRIARWNGAGWSPLGSGVNGAVNALAVFGGELYVGGFFTTAGGQPHRYLARWDGLGWNGVGTPPDNPVLALVASASRLYAGGYFQTIGGQPASNVAEWDGASWQRLGSGTDGEVRALALYKDGLYAGGSFQQAGAKSSVHLARWELGATGVAEPGPAVERLLELTAPWPNPFSASTRIRFTLPVSGAVSAFVFDAQGRLVRRLLPGELRDAGTQFLEWDGRDDAGAERGAGIYFVRLLTPVGAVSRKVLIER